LKLRFATPYPPCRALSPTKFKAEGRTSRPPEAGQKGEAIMTNVNKHIPAQHSAFSTIVVNLFTGAVLVLAGFLTFAQFANI
jgi:hypothetical protein